MGIPFEILLLTSGAGALQSAFFSVYLFSIRKERSLANVLLALLLLAFAVRIVKSVVYYFSLGHQVSTVVMNFGFGANLAIFPLLLLYLNSFHKKEYRFDWWRHSPHLIPALLVILLSPVLTSYFWMEQHGYAISLWSAALYLPFCVRVIVKNFQKINNTQRVWVLSVTVGVLLVWAAYMANFIFGLVPYIAAPVAFSFLIYFLSYLGLKKGEIFRQREKYERSAYSEDQIDRCFEELQTWFASHHPYRDASITLPKMADQLKVPANLLSETINSRTQQSFPDYINSFRIKDARELLKDPAYDQEKIATIAHQTGFKSISVFNAAFKKHANTTPSAYRNCPSRA
ncbi:MAG TPA: helix-turn-helix transcriptional regulator [Chryseolinea sp.]